MSHARIVRRTLSIVPSLAAASEAGIARAAAPVQAPAKTQAPALLGITYAGWKGDYRTAREAPRDHQGDRVPDRVIRADVCVRRPRQDRSSAGPDAAELGAAVEAALRAGFSVVIKPHLDPPAYQPGFDPFKSENDSWRVMCPWRGFYDLDPMAVDYREGVVFETLRMLKDVLDRAGPAAPTPVRLEVGAELMNSVVYTPERWEQLLAAAKKERHRLGLDGKVALSHNFDAPHRDPRGLRRAHERAAQEGAGPLHPRSRRPVAVAVHGPDGGGAGRRSLQSPPERGGDLTGAGAAREGLPAEILIGALGLKEKEIPPLHIGEFGIGRGGLRHPNLWAGAATAEQEKQLAREIARGHEGLLRYLALPEGRTAKSAVLWVLGQHYDIFGWENPKYANPEAAAAIKGALNAAAPPPPEVADLDPLAREAGRA